MLFRSISKPIDENKLKQLGYSSVEGIEYIRSLFVNYDFKKYSSLRDEISKKTTFIEGFEKIIKTLQKDYCVIFITSGLKDICSSKLKDINFNLDNIIGGELDVSNNKIVGSKLIVTDKMKGEVIKIGRASCRERV